MNWFTIIIASIWDIIVNTFTVFAIPAWAIVGVFVIAIFLGASWWFFLLLALGFAVLAYYAGDNFDTDEDA